MQTAILTRCLLFRRTVLIFWNMTPQIPQKRASEMIGRHAISVDNHVAWCQLQQNGGKNTCSYDLRSISESTNLGGGWGGISTIPAITITMEISPKEIKLEMRSYPAIAPPIRLIGNKMTFLKASPAFILPQKDPMCESSPASTHTELNCFSTAARVMNHKGLPKIHLRVLSCSSRATLCESVACSKFRVSAFQSLAHIICVALVHLCRVCLLFVFVFLVLWHATICPCFHLAIAQTVGDIFMWLSYRRRPS